MPLMLLLLLLLMPKNVRYFGRVPGGLAGGVDEGGQHLQVQTKPPDDLDLDPGTSFAGRTSGVKRTLGLDAGVALSSALVSDEHIHQKNIQT